MMPYLLLAAAIFAAGAYGVLARRNLLVVLMSLELMLNGVNIALVAFSARHAALPMGAAADAGQVLVLIVMAVAAAEVAIGLAIVIAIFRTRQTVDVRDLEALSG